MDDHAIADEDLPDSVLDVVAATAGTTLEVVRRVLSAMALVKAPLKTAWKPSLKRMRDVASCNKGDDDLNVGAQMAADAILKIPHDPVTMLFHCPNAECNYSCKRRYNLKTHYLSLHLSAKQYPCGICGKAFSRKNDMEKHEMTHQNLVGGRFLCKNPESEQEEVTIEIATPPAKRTKTAASMLREVRLQRIGKEKQKEKDDGDGSGGGQVALGTTVAVPPQTPPTPQIILMMPKPSYVERKKAKARKKPASKIQERRAVQEDSTS